MHFPWRIIVLFFIPTSLAVLVNVTIDDTLGDFETGRLITYIPDGEWNVGPSCISCAATGQLDRNMIHGGTWHDGIANKSPVVSSPQQLLASVPFYGSAVYVYCIIANTKDYPNGNTDMTFLVDSQPAGEYIRQPTGDNTFQYNVLVFASQSLPHGNHTLTIQNGHIGGPMSLVLLDYIVYSYDNGSNAPATSSSSASFVHLQPQPTSTSSTSAATLNQGGPAAGNSSGKIVGGVFGSVGVLLLGLVAFLWNRQRKSEESIDLSSPPTPPPKDSAVNPGGKFVGGILGSVGVVLHRLVAFLSSRQQKPKGSIDLSSPPAPPPKPRVMMHVNRIQRWWQKPNSETTSRFSFNPSLLAEPMVNRHHTIVSRSYPPPVRTVLPIQPPLQRPDSTRPLQPNRERTPSPPVDPRNERRYPMSILEWQRRTQLEADATPPPFDVTDRDLSSYYDFSSDRPDEPPLHSPRPRSVPRRFTVVNN